MFSPLSQSSFASVNTSEEDRHAGLKIHGKKWAFGQNIFSPHHRSIYRLCQVIIPAVKGHSFWINGGRTWGKRPELKSNPNHSCCLNLLTTVKSPWFCLNYECNELIGNFKKLDPSQLGMLSLMKWFGSTVNQIFTMIRSAYAGRDWLLPHGLMGSESSSVVSAGEADSSSWLSGVTAPPDREHSVRSSCNGDAFMGQM